MKKYLYVLLVVFGFSATRSAQPPRRGTVISVPAPRPIVRNIPPRPLILKQSDLKKRHRVTARRNLQTHQLPPRPMVVRRRVALRAP